MVPPARVSGNHDRPGPPIVVPADPGAGDHDELAGAIGGTTGDMGT